MWILHEWWPCEMLEDELATHNLKHLIKAFSYAPRNCIVYISCPGAAQVPQMWILHEWWPREMLEDELSKRNLKHLTQHTFEKTCKIQQQNHNFFAAKS